MLGQSIYYLLLIWCKSFKQSTFYAVTASLLQSCLTLPIHQGNNVVSRGYKLRFLVAYEIIAACTVL